jgi:hypothetical protein
MKTKPLTDGDRAGKGLSLKFELDAHTASSSATAAASTAAPTHWPTPTPPAAPSS